MTGNPTGNGKNKTRLESMRLHTDSDRLNIKQVNYGIKKNLLPMCKILPTKFHKFSKNEKSVSQRILKWVAIPAGTTECDYWNQIIISEVNNTYCYFKSNMTEQVKKQFEGTLDCAIVNNNHLL